MKADFKDSELPVPGPMVSQAEWVQNNREASMTGCPALLVIKAISMGEKLPAVSRSGTRQRNWSMV